MTSLLMSAYAGTYNPTFPSEITPLGTIDRDAQREMVTRYLKELATAHRKHVRWLERCDAYSAGTAEAPPLSAMPSKTAKYKMYDKSGYVNTLCGWSNPEQTARCGSLGDIAKQIEAVKAALAKF